MPKTYSSDIQLDNEVLMVLNWHRGQKSPIKRWTLVRRIFGDDAVSEETQNDENLYDRAVRTSIERLRNKGNHICNRGTGEGYYIADNRDEYEEFKKYFLGPAYKKLMTVEVMDDAADARWGKVEKQTPQGQAVMQF